MFETFFSKVFVSRKAYKNLVGRLNYLEKEIDALPGERENSTPAMQTKVRRIVVKRSKEEEDLTVIKGIGKVLQNRLYGIGITRLSQLAGLSPDEVVDLEQKLDIYKGRIEREDWVTQARTHLST